MELKAKGPGPQFRWVAAGFTNTGPEPRDVVITIPSQGFLGSGFMPLRRVGNRIISHNLAGPIELVSMPMLGESAYAFTLAPNTTAAIAFEIADGSVPAFTLWQRDAYDAKKDYFSFFRGALLGVSVLLALALFALYGFRSRAVFPVAGGFAVASVAFMMFEAGHLPSVVEAASLQGLDLQSARAIIEGAMAAFLLLLLATQSELQRISRMAGNLLLVLGGLAFAIPIYGFAEPLLATTIARGLFAATAVGGFLLIFVLWRRQEAKAETALVSWSAILLWTFLAAVAALSGDPAVRVLRHAAGGSLRRARRARLSPWRIMPSARAISRATSSARRGVMRWPWPAHAPMSGTGSRRRASSTSARKSSGRWPSRPAYLPRPERGLHRTHASNRPQCLSRCHRGVGLADGRMPIEKDFRLRHADGSYRWFQLKARAIPGHGQRAARCIGTLTDVTAAKLVEERLLQDAVYDRGDGPSQSGAVHRPADARPGGRERNPCQICSCCWSTSTASRWSMTRWAMMRAMRCLPWLAAG